MALLYALGYLWLGASLALVFGVWDGLDGKLARLNEQTTELGKREHIVDYFIEMSWWTALAYHFHTGGQVRYAYVLLIAFIAADLFDRIARRSVEPKLGRNLDDMSRFDRLVRLVAGRRNIYTCSCSITDTLSCCSAIRISTSPRRRDGGMAALNNG